MLITEPRICLPHLPTTLVNQIGQQRNPMLSTPWESVQILTAIPGLFEN